MIFKLAKQALCWALPVVASVVTGPDAPEIRQLALSLHKLLCK
jgi:hypothetical protein